MSSNHDDRPVAQAPTLVGGRDSQRPQAVRERSHLQLESPNPRNKVTRDGGSDPYNTSGSFDRKKNWARVGKR